MDLSVTKKGDTRYDTSETVTSTAKTIQARLKKLTASDDTPAAKEAATLTRWTMTSLQTSSYHDCNSKKKQTYVASIAFNIRFRKSDALGDLAKQFSLHPCVSIRCLDR